ncbi:MAG: Flp pilus assembly complex ATPase component TadA [Thermoanaerobaculia bacterium]|nr:Flp pilus assembly complex ATPase component TadA [Thermoanaerobaculia bacterium]
MIGPADEFAHRLGSELVENGLLTPDQLGHLAELRTAQGRCLSDLVVTEGYVSAQEVLRISGEILELPTIELSASFTDVMILDVLPRDKAFALNVVPLFVVGNHLTVATSEPFDLAKLDLLGFATGKVPMPVFALASDIERRLPALYGEKKEGGELCFDSVDGDPDADSGDLGVEESQGPIVRLVNLILRGAIDGNATDIHIEPAVDGVRVRYRIDGLLRERPFKVPLELIRAISSRIKILSALDISEQRLPQDGKISLSYLARKIDLRVSTFPALHGEKIVIRILDPDRMQLRLDRIGLSEENSRRWRRLFDLKQGLILVTGPTGSGKTSTLYASLQEINRIDVNIVTLEDPIEYELAGITQAQVRPKVGFSFADGLRSILRQDPDVILLGEIRDLETAEIALQAALTGHLVLATLHTNDAPTAITRLLDLGVAGHLVAATVRGVLAQRLVRTLCSCRREGSCAQCDDSGYRGRTGIHELLEIGPELGALIADGATDRQLATAAARLGYRRLWVDGCEKVAAGITDRAELERVVAPESEEAGTTAALDGAEPAASGHPGATSHQPNGSTCTRGRRYRREDSSLLRFPARRAARTG